MRKPILIASICAATLLAGCASTYQLSLMPRDSGTVYQGTAVEQPGGEAQVSITLGDVTYSGTWVYTVPSRTYANTAGVSGWYGGWRGRPWWYDSGVVAIDRPGAVKALLQSPDGRGLRCDLRGMTGGSGGGTCTDDKGAIYDVQIRLVR